MTAPFFTNNDSELTRVEGLYIKERNPPAQISGAFLGVVGMVGEAVRGPVNKVIEITSEARFREIFGGRDYGSGGAVANNLWLSMSNKKFGKVAMVRAAAAAAVAATFEWETAAGGGGTAVLRLAASSPGIWGNDVKFKISNATDGDVNKFNVTLRYLGNDTVYKNMNISGANDNMLSIVGADDGNLVVFTKMASGRPVNTTPATDGADADGFVNLGETVAGFTSVAGTNGTIADTDFTGSGKGIDLLTAHKGLGVVMVAERMSAAIKAKIAINAATVSDRLFLIGADSDTVNVSTAVTDVSSYRSDRIVYCFNHPKTLDVETATLVTVRPESWMASILSQTDVDIHPGEQDTKVLNAGIGDLTFPSLAREDYITLREAGISALEKESDGTSFVSGVTASLTPGKTEITRRRSADYLQLSVANTLKYSVKKKNTPARRKANAAMLGSFLNDLKRNERIVEDFLVDEEKLNTPTQRAAGVEKILMRVKLLGHMLFLVLETEIGTGVAITEVS